MFSNICFAEFCLFSNSRKKKKKQFVFEKQRVFLWTFHGAVCWLFYLNLQTLSFFNCMKSAVRITNLSSDLLEVADVVLLKVYIVFSHIFFFLK